FSSRRRHTRSLRDWSSDVCSSDLTGLGLCPGVVVFPEPEKRLRLDRKDRVARMARRFSPAYCLALPARSRVTWRAGKFEGSHGVQWMRADGEAVPFEPEETPR